jgi:hypothetical protein
VSTTLSEPIALPGAEVELCVAPGAVWWRWDRTLYRADAGAASLDEVGTLRDQPQRFACDAKRALSVSTSGTIVEAELCTAAACELAVTAEAPGYSRFAAGFTASGAVVVTRFEDVGLVWRGAENPAPIKLPEGTLRGAFEWGGAIYITLENDDKVSLSKLPTP